MEKKLTKVYYIFQTGYIIMGSVNTYTILWDYSQSNGLLMHLIIVVTMGVTMFQRGFYKPINPKCGHNVPNAGWSIKADMPRPRMDNPNVKNL